LGERNLTVEVGVQVAQQSHILFMIKLEFMCGNVKLTYSMLTLPTSQLQTYIYAFSFIRFQGDRNVTKFSRICWSFPLWEETLYEPGQEMLCMV